MGVAPNETLEEAKKEMEFFLKELTKKDEWFQKSPAKLEWFGATWLPGNLEEGHELIQSLSQAYQKIRGSSPVRIEASPWGTDGGILSNIGQTPVVVFGPGTTQVAHDCNEYIVLDHVFEAAEMIALMILVWCGIED